MSERTRGAVRKTAPARKHAAPQAPERRGTPSSGRIDTLLVGQGYGFIRLSDRQVFFHRSDVLEGTAFNELSAGDAVTFELLEDAVSGPRALRVTRPKSRT